MDILPHNIEAEQALLGAILLSNEHYGAISATLAPEHLFEPIHARILSECGRLITSGKKATPITLKDALPDVEVAPGISVAKYLAKLAAEGAAAPFERDGYISRVKDLAQMRSIISAADRLKAAGSDCTAPEVALRETWDHLDELRSSTREDTGERGAIASMVDRILEGEAAANVVTTGLSDLDKAIAGGWRAGRLYVLAGRPGMGKSIIATGSARRLARKGEACSLFSLEIDANEILARMASDTLSKSHTPIPYRDIVAGTFDRSSMDNLKVAVERLRALPVRIDASGGLTITEIEARARIDRERFKKHGKRLSVVFIDYLGLIRASDRYRGNKVHELGEIALAAKVMAKRLDVAVVLLAQLSRGVEGRDDKRPVMSDLRDSGNIEEHADFVGLLYRPSYYLERSPAFRKGDPEATEEATAKRFDLELIVGKNRLGPTTVVDLWCNPSLSAIDNKAKF